MMNKGKHETGFWENLVLCTLALGIVGSFIVMPLFVLLKEAFAGGVRL